MTSNDASSGEGGAEAEMSIQTALRRLLFPPEVKAPLWSLATLWQMLRYMLTGLVGFIGLSAPLLLYLTDVYHVWYVAASAIAYFVIGSVEWLMRRYLVFPQGIEEKAK